MSENRALVFCVGVRPDLIKMAPLILECRKRELIIEIVHSGQHYDTNMDAVFLRDLDLPRPSARLLAPEDRKGKSTGWVYGTLYRRMMKYLVEVGQNEMMPVVVYGDTWSALACASAAKTRGFPVVHVEAGLRSYDVTMPEENARIQMDAMAEFLFPPTEASAKILRDEGMRGQSWVCGNLAVDALQMIKPNFDLVPKGEDFAVMTLHRPENIENVERLRAALQFVGEFVDKPVYWPLHPRAKDRLRTWKMLVPKQVTLMDPIGYAEMVGMLKACSLVVTDSGGLQEEACILGVPCVTLRKNTERPETLVIGANVLVDVLPPPGSERIDMNLHKESWQHPYGENVARKIADVMEGLIDE